MPQRCHPLKFSILHLSLTVCVPLSQMGTSATVRSSLSSLMPELLGDNLDMMIDDLGKAQLAAHKLITCQQ